MSRLYANNYTTSLNGAITNVATTMVVNSVTGLPAIGSGDTCQLTIDDGTNIEIVTATAVSSFTITITRAQEGTSGTAFADTDTVELRTTSLSHTDVDASSTLTLPSDAAPTVAAEGDCAIDSSVTDFSHGVLKYFGTEEMGTIAMPIAEFSSPTDAHVVSYNATSDEFELVAQTGGSDTFATIEVDATPVSTAAPTLNFASADFLLSESPADDFAITIVDQGYITDATTDTLTNKTINTASNTITIVSADVSDLGSSTVTFTNKTFDANGTGNSLSNVDVADLANGTDGELITWSATGVAATVAVGTATHVLTSNGVGVAPTFQAAAGGGDPDQNLWETVNSDSGSTAANTTTDTLNVFGGEGIDTSVVGDTLTIAGEIASAVNLGIAGFGSADFGVAAGFVSINDNYLLNSGDIGTGVYDFGGATSLEIPNSATPTVNADGELAVDTTVTDFSLGVMKFYGGEEQGVVSMPIAEFTSPTDGHVVTYNATNDEFELAAAAGGADTFAAIEEDGVSISTAAPTLDFNGTDFVIVESPTDDFDISIAAASDTVAGKIEIATAAEVKTGTSTTQAMVPGRFNDHNGACKVWCLFNGDGTPAALASYNVASIGDVATGAWDIFFDTDFSGTDTYGATALTHETSGEAIIMIDGGVGAASMRFQNTDGVGTLIDSTRIGFTAFGDQ